MKHITSDAFLPGPRYRLAPTLSGPLTGLTFAAKDLFDVAGTPTGAGNPDWECTHPVPQVHAWAVGTLLDAGAELVGKTVTCEISLGILGFNQFFGTPANPTAPGSLPGGSSSGSASAVAAGDCDIALGTDTGGSVRVPASLCGLHGLRTTHGRIPFAGVCAQAPSFDTVGWFTRDAASFARAAAVLLQEPIPALAPAPLLVADDAFVLADAEVRDALAGAVALLGRVLRHAPRSIDLGPPGTLVAWSAQRNILQRYEGWRTFRDWIDAANPRFAFNVARNLTLAAGFTDAQAAEAAGLRRRVLDRARELLQGGAILCLPTTPFTAPPLGLPLHELDMLSERISQLTSFAGFAGLPQLSLPLGMAGGKPCGLSILAWHGQDAKLVAIAEAVERARTAG
jgi:amidase